MLEIGEIKKGKEIGFKNATGLFMWLPCSQCGGERWVKLRFGNPIYILCHTCVQIDKGKQKIALRLSLVHGTIENPQIGDVRNARELNRKTNSLYIWQACSGCGKERWTQYSKGRIKSIRCHRCGNNWQGGRYKNKDGYIIVNLEPSDPFYSMAHKDGDILEHRLVVARRLGRCLKPWELVHHRNQKRDDNSDENLVLTSRRPHQIITVLESRLETTEKRLTLLEAENAVLQAQLKQAYETVKEEIEK